MKTKYVIQFRSGPLKDAFVSNWTPYQWLFTTASNLHEAHRFDSLSICNFMRILLDVPADTVALVVQEPQLELRLFS